VSRRPRSPLVLLLLLGCSRPEAAPSGEPPPPPKEKKPPAAAPSLPAGFEVKGKPEVSDPFLPPDATWRWLVSELRLRQAEGKELLVSFDAAAVHMTDREGHRRTFRLPKGLRLAGVPAHVLLKADLGMEIALDSGMQVVGEEEVTVVTARIDMGGGNVQEIRLVAKEGVGFRSISTGGEAG